MLNRHQSWLVRSWPESWETHSSIYSPGDETQLFRTVLMLLRHKLLSFASKLHSWLHLTRGQKVDSGRWAARG